MSNKFKIIPLLAFLFGAIGCFKDLDTEPIDPKIQTAANVYDDPSAYKGVLAKLYAGYSVTGQQGPSGRPDISGIDEGFGQYLRMMWYHQELVTEEAVIGWNDQTVKDFHLHAWTSADGFVYAFYSRIFYQIALANEFIRETADAKLDARGVDAATRADIKKYRAEARFLRALSYWHALDHFRNPPFATEENIVGSFVPEQTNPEALFTYLEKELKEMEPDLAAPRTNEYGRADKAAAWMLLAKLYLNAEVYVGRNQYQNALEYSEKVLTAGFTLDPVYQNLFLADNEKSPEIIFPITYDGLYTRTWGGTTFIIRAGIGGSMNPVASGVVSGWSGTRTTRQLIEKFPADLTGKVVEYNPGYTVKRAKLYVPGSHQNFNFEDLENSLAALDTLAPNNKIFEGHLYFPSAGTEIYFSQIPSATAPKFGDNGADGKLETNGAKIVVPEAGLHFMRVNLAATPKTYVIEKRSYSIIGTATGGVDVPLTWDAELKVLKTANTELSVGSFKIRVNGTDAVTYGDNGANAILESGGAEIAIAKSGGHQIFLDLDKPDYTYEIRLTGFDRRGLFHSDGQQLDIDDMTLFNHGYAINKFKNVTSTGAAGKSIDHPDTDFPMFRLADAYLMAAECILRGAGGGDKAKAAEYFNAVRTRAYSGGAGNLAAADLNLDVLLDERARELYWECHRRTDLVRFGKFTTGNYHWQWKGNVKEGRATEAFRNIFPIPSADLGANPNLKQNPGY